MTLISYIQLVLNNIGQNIVPVLFLIVIVGYVLFHKHSAFWELNWKARNAKGEQALRYAEKAVDADPLNPEGHLLCAEILLMELKRYDNAIESLNQALRLMSAMPEKYSNPERARALVMRALAREVTYDFAGALADYSEVVKYDTNGAFSFILPRIVTTRIKNKDYAGALQELDELVARYPKNTDKATIDICIGAYEELLWIRLAQENHEEAKAFLDRIARLASRAGARSAWDKMRESYATAHVARAAGNTQDALLHMDNAIRENPRNVEHLLARSMLRRTFGDTAGTLADADQAISLSAANPVNNLANAPALHRSALHLRGFALTVLGRLPEAIAAFTQARDLTVKDDADKSAALQIAFLCRAQGDLPVALAEFDRAVKQQPDDIAALLFRARTRLALGDATGAQADFTAADALDSSLTARFRAAA